MNTMTREQALDAFVGREIYLCQTSLVEEAFKQGILSVDEIYNLYPEFDGYLLSPSVCIACNKNFTCLDSETGRCEECFEEVKEPQEIFEWWVVSPWLAKKLLMEGAPVIDNEYGHWWGRTTTGQAISLDYIIEKVYEDIMTYTG